jgi:hypothetical protein
MSLKEMGRKYVGWIEVAQDMDKRWPLVKKTVKLRVPKIVELVSQNGLC